MAPLTSQHPVPGGACWLLLAASLWETASFSEAKPGGMKPDRFGTEGNLASSDTRVGQGGGGYGDLWDTPSGPLSAKLQSQCLSSQV